MKISPWATGAMKVAIFSAAFAIPRTGIAMAAGPISATSGNGSILGGNQINLPVSAPVDICGNGAGILGLAAAGCEGGASVSNGGGSGPGGIERTARCP
jgi:ChpA-C